MSLDDIQAIVEYSFENIGFYKKKYLTEPKINNLDDFENIPITSKFEMSSYPYIDFTSKASEVHSVLPTISEIGSSFPFPVVDNELDIAERKNVFGYCLDLIGIDVTDLCQIISLPNNYYFSIKLLNLLTDSKIPSVTSTFKRGKIGSNDNYLGDIEPSVVFAPWDYLYKFKTDLPDSVNKIVTIRNMVPDDIRKDLSSQGIGLYYLYVIPELGWIGVKQPGSKGVKFSERHFYIETDNEDNIIVTSLLYKSLPFIRYQTMDKGTLIGREELKLNFIGGD